MDKELSYILESPEKGHVIIIDDARCFGTDPAYPTISDLEKMVMSKREDVTLEVAGDSIRITPTA